MRDSESTVKHEADPAEVDDRAFLTKARRFAGRIPFVRDLVAMWYSMLDDKTPLAAKAILAGAIVYFVSPIDLLPDFVAFFGFSDDAAVALAALKAVGGHVQDRHYERADEFLLRNEALPVS